MRIIESEPRAPLVRKILPSALIGLMLAVAISGSAQIIPAGRRISWNPGIPGGIPVSTNWATINVKNPPYNAVGDGVADDYSAIQSAIAAAGRSNVVYVPSGTYRLSNQLRIDYNNPKTYLVIRGDGPTKTKLICYDLATADRYGVIQIQNTSAGTVMGISSGYTKDSTNLVLSSAYGTVGDYVKVDQQNDPAFVTSVNQNGVVDTYLSRNNGTRCMGQIVRITAVNGATLTITPALYFTFTAALQPQAYWCDYMPGLSKYVGIEDLCVQNVTNSLMRNIYLEHPVHCWIRNVESYNCGPAHVYIGGGYGCVVRDSYFHHSHSYAGGQGYGVLLMDQSADCLVENNVFYYLRHSMVFESGGCGNVLGYNYSQRMFDETYPNTDWLMGDIITHGAHPYMNLVEGNIADFCYFDAVHGSSSHNTIFRNWIVSDSQGETNKVIYQLRSVMVDKTNYYENIVGNILGKTGQTGVYETNNVPNFNLRLVYQMGYSALSSAELGPPADTNVALTVLRHGNYDYMSGTTRWDSSIPDHTIPASYYLTSKPSWFGNLAWPAIGPDLASKTGQTPAQVRFNALQALQTPPPSAPVGLRVAGSSN